MSNLYERFFKVTIVSLIIATIALIFLMESFYNILIQNQKYTANIIYKEILISKIMQMKHEFVPFQELIDDFKKATNINIEVYSFIHNKKNFFDYLKKIDDKGEYWHVKNDKFIFYKPIKLQQSCMKCHAYSFIHQPTNPIIRKINRERILGVMKISLPLKKEKRKYYHILIIVFLVLFGALVLTMYGYLKNIDLVRKNINSLIEFFEENIAKGKYVFIKTSMNFEEFEKLKEKINYAINKIKFYRQKTIERFYYNQLTELPNLYKLKEEIKKIKKPLAIININDFKTINNTFGFDIGNLVIYAVAMELKKYQSPLYHLSIDEFAFFLKSEDEEYNKIYMEKFLDKLKKTFYINEHEITISYRCGISKVGDYILNADMAIEYAKQKRKECVFFCDIKDEIAKMKQNALMLTKISNAIKNNLFEVYYQPIIDNKTGEIYKYEALIRMKDEEGNLYTPDKFLELSKKANIYPKITKIVIDKVCEKLKQKTFYVSVNLDILDFENDEIKEYILKKVIKEDCGKYLSFELLETSDLSEKEEVISFIRELKQKGSKILIDDFGSGFSNFSYIFRFNIDGIKIDASLIKDILIDKFAQDLVISIVEFAKKRGIITIAEYVANEEIYEFVKKMGIDYSQGYYFSPPKPDVE